MEQRNSSAVNTKFLVMTLLGDYIMHRGGAIWLSDLLDLLAILDVGERTARSTISRMAQEGWFTIERTGRRSRYTLTQRGYNILQQGDLRIYEDLMTDWDGVWHLVVYSLPEDKRKLRDHFRKQLAWLGFGPLAPGTWLSPHKRDVELNRVLAELGIEAYVHFFSGTHWGQATGPELVKQCWDLPSLAENYTEFLERHQPIYKRSQEELNNGLTQEEGFARRFWMTCEFLPYLRDDPNLPAQLLPPNWIGFQARQLFADYRTLLDKMVNPFLDEVVLAE